MHGLTNAQGQTSQLTLEGTLSDGSKKDVTSTALWSSSNRNVVTVTAAGPILPYASLDGVYSLTFTASPSCNLPDDAVKRTYTATIAQTDAALTIVLSGARFGSSGQVTLN